MEIIRILVSETVVGRKDVLNVLTAKFLLIVVTGPVLFIS